MSQPTTATLCTAMTPGAIAIVQLHGPSAGEIVRRLCGTDVGPRSRLVEIPGVDEALVVALRDDWFQIMPHGGVRVVQQLMHKLIELGAKPGGEPDARGTYPEASSDLDADMLATLALAASPAAIDLLMRQPALWARWTGGWEKITAHSAALDRLVHAPTVVLAGRPNVGKSTLSNLVMGRAASITADLPGTTRDWVAGLAELRTPIGEVAVRWFDTPGLRDSADPIEQRAIELARGVVKSADVLVAVRDPATGWVDPAELPREPDVWVLNKCDLPSAIDERPSTVRVSALRGEGLDELSAAVGRALGLGSIDAAVPWAFSPRLKAFAAGADSAGLQGYIRG